MELLDMIEKYSYFEINDISGLALSENDIITNYTSKIHKLQSFAFNNFCEILPDLVFSSVGELTRPGMYLISLSNTSI
jgi:hypothetical protein